MDQIRSMLTVKTGLDVFLSNPEHVGRVGLLTNVASLDMHGHTSFRALQAAGIDIQVIFSPEHGYFGLGSAGEFIADDSTGAGYSSVPIMSLYGPHHAPSVEHLATLDSIIVDLQDVGIRWYTFLATLRDMMSACAEAGKPVLVLDRPNPLSGLIVEGLLAQPDHFSLVAPAAIPVRYGLTIGEFARWLNQHQTNAEIKVIPLVGWQRSMYFADTGLVWASPSPNMPRPETALCYGGTCLIEGTNVSEGRGTALPFEQFGAPFIHPEEITTALNRLSLPGIYFTPTWFRPTTSKNQGADCGGARIHIYDAHAVGSFGLGLHIISMIKRLYPTRFNWISWGDHFGIDRLAASGAIRTAIDNNQSVEEILAWCDDEAQRFQAESAAYRLYD